MARQNLILFCSFVFTLLVDHPQAVVINHNAGIVQQSLDLPSGQITCFGDSWAAFACDSLKDTVKIKLKKNKVVNKGVPGSTAAVFASDTTAMVADILAGGFPEFIWLSIGGNDILGGWSAGVCVGNATGPSALACYDTIYNNTATMLDALFHTVPTLQVVQFGYDYTNFVGSAECVLMASKIFHNDTSQQHINEIFMAFDEHVLLRLAQRYNKFAYTHTPLWGTLQAHGGDVGEPVPPPYPNIHYPSPLSLMNDGCIHASKEGWLILMNALWNSYFAGRG
eukprot:m.27516 g.27516  ORF g.27516 m.27516 type:complete len:281 (-) comp15761_c1_seq1:40-882(-)